MLNGMKDFPIYNIKKVIKNKNNGNRNTLRSTKVLSNILFSGSISDFSKYTKNKNIFNKSYLPRLRFKNNTIDSNTNKKYINESLTKNDHIKLEMESLNEQNVQYKKIIKKLMLELNSLNIESVKKEKILYILNQRIGEQLDEIKEENNKANYDNEQITKNKILTQKMRNKITEKKQELMNEKSKMKYFKKEYKFTKRNEMLIEKDILNEHKNKILLLIANSKNVKKHQKNELLENFLFYSNYESQSNIIKNLEKAYNELLVEESCAQNEIRQYIKALSQSSRSIKIVKIKQISLKNINLKLIQERKDFKVKHDTIENLNDKLFQSKKHYSFVKLINKKSIEKLSNIRKNYNLSLEFYKKIKKQSFLPKKEEQKIRIDKNFNNA